MFNIKSVKKGHPAGDVLRSKEFVKKAGQNRVMYQVEVSDDDLFNPANSIVAKLLVNGDPMPSIWVRESNTRSIEHDIREVSDGAALQIELVVLSPEKISIGLSRAQVRG
jgi:hypothetical protein